MKMVSFVVTLLMAGSAFAYSTNYTNLDDKATYVEAVQASNQDGVISLRVVVKNVGQTVAPKAAVIDQVAGFKCQVIKTNLLESSYDAASNTFTQSFEAKVIWTPGAENSGCVVQVFHPSLNNTRAVIYKESTGDTSGPVYQDDQDSRDLY
ncbi:MAG: hypothetical protein J7501_08285 [Bdellovibrio sp.]|nr:hypothetical protein [Bdellovibrio sp.]